MIYVPSEYLQRRRRKIKCKPRESRSPTASSRRCHRRPASEQRLTPPDQKFDAEERGHLTRGTARAGQEGRRRGWSGRGDSRGRRSLFSPSPPPAGVLRPVSGRRGLLSKGGAPEEWLSPAGAQRERCAAARWAAPPASRLARSSLFFFSFFWREPQLC